MHNIGMILGYFVILALMVNAPLPNMEDEDPVVIEVVENDDSVYEPKTSEVAIAEPIKMEYSEEKTEETTSEIVEVDETIEPVEPVKEELISKEDLELIALVTMAEAEGECEEGKRLVIDTILNRVDSELAYFPDTIKEVIYQKDQFTSMWNGRVDKCYIDEEICKLVEEEVKSRTNYEVMYFHSKRYGAYGTPMFSVGNHYFSSN